MLVTFYPNREIKISVGRKRPVRKSDSDVELRKFDPVEESDRHPLDSFNLIPKLSQDRETRKRKRRPMTNAARHSILHLAGLMKRGKKKRQVFCTGTLPGGSEMAMKKFSEMSGYLIKNLQTYLCRSLSVTAKTLRWIYVWEHQKRGALHLHMVCECPNSGVAKKLEHGWRALWCKLLNLVAEKGGVDIFERSGGGSWADCEEVWQVDSERVKKAVDRYLAKYLRKSEEHHDGLAPGRWYGASSALREELRDFIAENSVSFDAELDKYCEVSEVKESLSDAFDRISDKGGIDRSQWFQESSVSFSGYLKRGLSLSWGVDIMLEHLAEFVDMGMSYKRVESQEGIENAVVTAFSALYGTVPIWAWADVEQSFVSAFNLDMSSESVATAEGWTHFYSSMAHIFKANESVNDDPDAWYRRMHRLIKGTQKRLDESPVKLRTIEEKYSS